MTALRKGADGDPPIRNSRPFPSLAPKPRFSLPARFFAHFPVGSFFKNFIFLFLSFVDIFRKLCYAVIEYSIFCAIKSYR